MEHTEVLQDENAPEFTSVPGNPRAVDLAWSRDGRGAPGPGVGGVLFPIRERALSRQLLARTADGRRFLLEIPRDRLDAEAFPEVWGEVDNRTIEEIWRNRTIAAASMVTGDASGPPVALGFEEYPTLLICQEKGVIFHPPWAGPGPEEPIEVCRDDDALERAGLPGFETSAERFLFNPVAARTTSVLKLYTSETERPPIGNADVGTRDDFVRDLASRVAAGDQAGPRRGRFPCSGCDQVPHCYPAAQPGAPARPGQAVQRIRPVSFYPFRAIARPVDVLSFAEHSDRIGGATWSAFRRRHVQKWRLPGLSLAREGLERTAFLDVAQTHPLRAVSKKLGLFESVVEEVRRYHRMFGQPHLGISPDNVVSTSIDPRPDGGLPTQLLGQLRSPMLRDDRTPPPGAPIWLPPPDAQAPYAPADLVEATRSRRDARAGARAGGFAFGLPFPVRASVGRLWDDATRGTCEYELTLASDVLQNPGIDAQDLVKVEVNSPGWEKTVLWCRADAERPAEPGRLHLRGFPVMLASGQRLDMQQAQGQAAMFGSSTVYRGYGASYDVHALGMLLLHLLLDNANQGIADLAGNALPPLTRLVARAAADGPRGWHKLVEGVEHAVRTPPLDAFLTDQNACFFGSEVVETAQRVPPRLWAELLATVLACITTESAISYCSTTRIERDRDAFCAPVERLLEKVRELRAALPVQRTDPIPAASIPTVPPGGAPTLPPGDRDADLVREVKRLKAALSAQAAQIKRLESERDAVKKARAQAERESVRDPARDGAVQAWNEILAALAGTPDHRLPTPRPGDPVFELVKTIAVDGLDTISALLTAAAELGGQEFANEQQNLRRVIRRVLAQGAPSDETGARQLDHAGRHFQRARRTLGGVIAALVEAHGRSTKDGARQMLVTLEVGMRRELKLNKGDTKKLAALMERMKDNLGELIARLYDPAFHRQVQKHVERGMR